MIIEFVYRETYSSRQDITFNAISNCSEVVELGQGQTRLLEPKYTLRTWKQASKCIARHMSCS